MVCITVSLFSVFLSFGSDSVTLVLGTGELSSPSTPSSSFWFSMVCTTVSLFSVFLPFGSDVVTLVLGTGELSSPSTPSASFWFSMVCTTVSLFSVFLSFGSDSVILTLGTGSVQILSISEVELFITIDVVVNINFVKWETFLRFWKRHLLDLRDPPTNRLC